MAGFDALTGALCASVTFDPARAYTADSVQKVDAGTDAIGLHAENGNTPRVPELIAFYCRRAAREGSATTLCDGAALLDDLPDALRARFDVPLTVTRTLPEGLRNVSPERVEAALTGDGTILQAVVHGDGEPVLSALVTSPCDDARIDAAAAAANAGLPDYARIGVWRRVPPLTREDGLLTGNGKPRRDAVLHRYAPGAPADAVARAGGDALPTRAA